MSLTGEVVDLSKQARYYLEWVLAKLHGVSFGAHDAIEDRSFEPTSEVQELSDSYIERERSRFADPVRGRLYRHG